MFRPWLWGIGAGGDATCGAFSDGSIGGYFLNGEEGSEKADGGTQGVRTEV